MNNVEPRIAELNEITTLVTAFASWADLTEACASGYVPTIRAFDGDSRDCRLNKAALAVCLLARGYKVFDGSRTLGA